MVIIRKCRICLKHPSALGKRSILIRHPEIGSVGSLRRCRPAVSDKPRAVVFRLLSVDRIKIFFREIIIPANRDHRMIRIGIHRVPERIVRFVIIGFVAAGIGMIGYPDSPVFPDGAFHKPRVIFDADLIGVCQINRILSFRRRVQRSAIRDRRSICIGCGAFCRVPSLTHQRLRRMPEVAAEIQYTFIVRGGI